MTNFLTTGWPWAGLGLAAILLALLFFTNIFRGNPAIPRFRDLAWLAWLALAIYMLHQFEEHGIDALGQSYAFRGTLCTMLGFSGLGFSDVPTCPVPVSFITAVNLATVWGGIALSALLGRTRPLLALSAFATPIVNVIAHIGPALVKAQYNPGLLTAIVLFLPVSFWAIRIAISQHAVKPSGVAMVVASGVALHVVLIGSILLFIHGSIGETTLNVIQIANAFVPVTVCSLGRRSG